MISEATPGRWVESPKFRKNARHPPPEPRDKLFADCFLGSLFNSEDAKGNEKFWEEPTPTFDTT
jgi:hypothetical protein